MRKKMFLVVVLILSMQIAYGATIHGTVYDLSLVKAEDVVIEIDTTPKQQFIAKNATYRFTVPEGNYTIKAQLFEQTILRSFVEENISVKDEGEYVLDLILFPSFEEEEGLFEEQIEISDISFEEKPREYTLFIVFVLVVVVIAVIFFFYRKSNKKKKPEQKETKEESQGIEDDLLKKVLDFIERQGKRTTQKDIRKEFPYSEAKISLIITDLEDKGLVKKIKKGRGNIIILKSKA